MSDNWQLRRIEQGKRETQSARASRGRNLIPVQEPRTAPGALYQGTNIVRRPVVLGYDSDENLSPYVIAEREFSFDLDSSIVGYLPKNLESVRAPGNETHRREYSLVSYQSELFSTEQQTAMNNESMDRELDEQNINRAREEVEREISRMRSELTAGSAAGREVAGTSGQNHGSTDAVLQQVIRSLEIMSSRLDVMDRRMTEFHGTQGRGTGISMSRHVYRSPSEQLDLTYGRTADDVRNRTVQSNGNMKLKDVIGMIPTFTGKSPEQIREFLNACEYAEGAINPAEESALLQAVLRTKLKGQALVDFETKDIRDFGQLKAEVEATYSAKRSTTQLQIEFNTLRQKNNESAQIYGQRVNHTAMELYESMVEGKGHTIEEKRTIMSTIKEQALQQFQIGLKSEIRLIIRSRNYRTLQEAVNAASSEEKVVVPPSSHMGNSGLRQKDKGYIKNACYKCGKIGHYGRDCRSSKTTLPKPSKNYMNTVEKHCNYCKKTGHTRDNCWSLNGKKGSKKFTAKREKLKSRSDSSESSSDEGEFKDKGKRKKSVSVADVQVTEINAVQAGLDLVTVPMKEAKRGQVEMLYDTGATITLMKKKYFKSETPAEKTKLELTGVTGHTACVIGKVKATIQLKSRKIKHTVYIVRDDFPINYPGILGSDFIKKYRAVHDYDKEKLVIGKESMAMHPYQNIVLQPRSETVVRAVTSSNQVGIVEAREAQPGVFIGCCLVQPENYLCPVSVLNATEREIIIDTPHVEIEKLSNEKEIKNAVMSTNVTEAELSRSERVKKALRMQHLNQEERDVLVEICEAYSDIFYLSGEPLSKTSAVKHAVRVKTDTAPINVKPYRLPEKHRKEVDRQVKEMLDNKIIRNSKSEWNAPLLVVPKKMDASGVRKLRVVVDFRRLNDVTIGDSFPLPNITEILDQLGNAKYFSTLDLASGYHQISMKKEDKEKTAFSTPYEHYEYNRMPFGLKNAPATFQRLMNAVLTGLQGIKCFVYLDDIVIHGASLEEHTKRVKEVFGRLREHNLRLQPDKCEFFRKEVTYLGHKITENGISPDTSKVSAVKEFPIPRKVKEVQAFIGLAGYYRKFISNFSKIAKPLTQLLQKGAKYEWGQEQQLAFETLKRQLSEAPLLAYPDFTREFIVTTDASGYAIGAVLSQGEIGRDKPIAYASRVLNKAERNYSTTEKELLAIVWAVKHFRPYLYGVSFKIVTDHRALVWLFNIKDPGSRLVRWRLKLEEYDYEVVYKKGKANTNADALSRSPAKIISTCEAEKTESGTEEASETQALTEEEKKQILYEYHNTPIGAHQGITRTVKRIQLKYNWPNLKHDVEDYVSRCESCQKNKLTKGLKAPMVITDTPREPFEKCALDIVGPLPVTNGGNRYLLTFQDNLTKFSKALPIPNQEAATVAKEFVTKVICEHGIPGTVLTDQGTNFVSELFKNVCKLLRIEKIQTTAYHPESNGALERSHRTLAEYIRHYVNEDQRDWDEWVPYAMFAYNTTPHTATGFTPFELVYGRRAELPTALTKPPSVQYNLDDYAQELKERLRAVNRVARENLKDEKEKAKRYYDKKTRVPTFKVGDKVLVYDETLRRGRSKKLESLWTGPFEVIGKTSGVTYTVKAKRRVQSVHANRLKLFVEN